MIMQKAQYNLTNPLDMIYQIQVIVLRPTPLMSILFQPIMVIVCIPFAVGFEGFSSLSSLLPNLPLVAGGGVIAFLMECAEFLLVSQTSSLTLSLAGIGKDIITIVLSVVFQDYELSVTNVAGVVVCLVGILLHTVMKTCLVERKEGGLREGGREEGGDAASGEALLGGELSDEEGTTRY